MGSRSGLWIWRVCVALLAGAVLTLGVTALSSPAGDLVPARVGESPSESSDATEDEEAQIPVEDERPTADETEGLPRMVGTPAIDVEVLSDSDEFVDDDTTSGIDNDRTVKDAGASQADSPEPASQIVATPQFTG